MPKNHSSDQLLSDIKNSTSKIKKHFVFIALNFQNEEPNTKQDPFWLSIHLTSTTLNL